MWGSDDSDAVVISSSCNTNGCGDKFLCFVVMRIVMIAMVVMVAVAVALVVV